MDLVRVADYDALSRRAATIVMAVLAEKPDAVLVFPVGATPRGLFARLVSAAHAGDLDVSQAHVVLLDDYLGIDAADRRSFAGWLRRDLLDPLGIPPAHVLAFDPLRAAAEDSARVEAAIAARGGIDLAILGLGLNGHLGFNEPGSAFDSRTRAVALAPETIASNARYWGSATDVPPRGLTLGLGTLADARRLVLLASGAPKSAVVARLLDAPPDPSLPASIARLHPSATLIADAAAAPLHAATSICDKAVFRGGPAAAG